jgi:hypothetical protein
MKIFDLLLKTSPLIFSCISLFFIISLITKTISYKNEIISINYKKSAIIKLSILLLIICINYIFLEFNWLDKELGNKLGDENKFWNLNETLNAIFNILAISKLYFAMNNNKKVVEKEKKGNNIIVEILTKVDDNKMKHIFIFIAFIVIAIIFFILALLGKQEAFSVLQPITSLIK